MLHFLGNQISLGGLIFRNHISRFSNWIQNLENLKSKRLKIPESQNLGNTNSGKNNSLNLGYLDIVILDFVSPSPLSSNYQILAWLIMRMLMLRVVVEVTLVDAEGGGWCLFQDHANARLLRPGSSFPPLLWQLWHMKFDRIIYLWIGHLLDVKTYFRLSQGLSIISFQYFKKATHRRQNIEIK